MDYSALREKIDSMQEEILEGIRDCVRIESVGGKPEEGAPYGRGPKEALEYALDLGKRLGFKAVNVDNKAGYIEMGEGEEMAAVLGHLDVVPAGEGWSHPPFAAEIQDGCLYGRGVVDDKGPTIGAIYGLKAIRDLGLPLNRRLRIIFGTNEERGCGCIKHYVKSGQELPVMGITPDAEYPMIFFEKGMTTVEGGLKNPSQGEIRVLEFGGGTAANIVPMYSRLVLEGKHQIPDKEGITVKYEKGNTVIEAEGVSAHASVPELGINAAVRLLKAVSSLKIGGDFQKFSDFICHEIGEETNGSSLGICFRDEETGETTVNLGLFSYTDEEVYLNLDIRYPKNGKAEEVRNKLDKALSAYGLELFEGRSVNMLYIPKDSELIQKLMAVYEEGTGDISEPKAIGGGTYAKMFSNMAAFGPVFPGDAEVAHQPDERVEIGKLMKSIGLTAAAMAEMSKVV